VAIEDAPATISTNREDLDKQREAKRKKEEMIEKKSLDKAKEDLIEASYYWDMFHSEVCWKGNLSIVTKMLGRLKSMSAQTEALKENIRMRVIGLGWKQFTITWSSKRSQATSERACCTSKNDHKGGEEANATEGSCFGNAQALQVANPGDCDKTTDGK